MAMPWLSSPTGVFAADQQHSLQEESFFLGQVVGAEEAVGVLLVSDDDAGDAAGQPPPEAQPYPSANHPPPFS